MKRAKHNLSHYTLASLHMGEFYPIMCMEVLPGDAMRHDISALIRVAPLVAPVMHPVHIHIGSWFVPNRLIWSGWEDFITDPDSGLTVPRVEVRDAAGAANTATTLGIPLGFGRFINGVTATALSVNALPFRAYNLIWNEFMRDQNIDTPLTVTTGNGPDTTTNYDLRRARWEKDYFTTARLEPQMGDSEDVLIRGMGPPVGTDPTDSGTFLDAHGDTITSPFFPGTSMRFQASGAAIGDTPVQYFTIDDWRQAMAYQRLREKRNRFGSRYTDVLASYGIRPADSRLQRPEYLGGGRSTIAFSEVLQTAPAEVAATESFVGEQAGHGIATARTRPYKRFFPEHGYVLTMMWVRPKTVYVDQVRRDFYRSTMQDYWTPESELLGDQAITMKEIYSNIPSGNADDVFGYQQRHDEYRRHPSSVSGEFTLELESWHFARNFSSAPALNSTFLECLPSTEPFADVSLGTDQLRAMIYNRVTARRLVSKFARQG